MLIKEPSSIILGVKIGEHIAANVLQVTICELLYVFIISLDLFILYIW